MFRTRLTSMFPLHLDDKPPAGGGTVESVATRTNKVAARFIALHGSEEAAIAALARENVTLTDDLTTERTRVAELKGKVPDPEKEVVLPKARVETFNRFEALKVTPEDVAKLQTENKELKGTVHVHGVEKMAAKAAPVFGFDPEATVDLVTGKGLHAELKKQEREVEKGGKKVKEQVDVLMVRPAADEKAQLVPLDEYAKTLPAFEQRALKATQQQQQSQGSTAGTGGDGGYIEQGPAARGGDSGAGQTVLANLAKRYPTPGEMRQQRKESSNVA